MAVTAQESQNLVPIDPFTELKADIDEMATKKSNIQCLWVSSIPWGQLTPLLFLGTTDSTLHAYVPTEIGTPPSSVNDQSDTIPNSSTLTFNHYMSYKHVHHTFAQLLESWGMYLTLSDTKLILYTLPLLTNSEIAQSDEIHQSKHKNVKVSTHNRMFIVSDTKQTLLFNAFEPGNTIVCVNKQNILKVFDRISEMTLQLRTQYDLTILLRDKKNSLKLSMMVLPLKNLIVIGDDHALLVFRKGWGLLELSTGEFVNLNDDVYDELGTEIGACVLVMDTLHNRSDNLCRFQGVFIAGKQKSCILTFEEQEVCTKEMSPGISDKRRWTLYEDSWVTYNATPKAVHCAFPYLLLDFQENVKVYQIGSSDYVQELPIRSLQSGFVWDSKQLPSLSLSNSTYFIGATAGIKLQLWKRTSVKDQIQSCLSLKNWKQAAALIELCPEACEISQEERKKVFKKLGFSTFYNHEPDENDLSREKRLRTAMEYFFQAHLSVLDVLCLFPRELLPQSDQSTASNPQVDDTILFTGKNDLIMVQKIVALIHYLNKSRKRLEIEGSQVDALVRVDTVWMKTLVFLSKIDKYQDQALKDLTKLFQNDNYCDANEVEWYLRTYELRQSLLLFFTKKSLHRNALELMEELEDEDHAGGAEMLLPAKSVHNTGSYLEKIAMYLQELNFENEKLFFEYAGRVIDRNPRLGLQILINRSIEKLPENDVDPLTFKDYLLSLKPQNLGSETSSQIDASNCDLLLEDSVVLPMKNGRFMAIEYLVRLIYARSRPIDVRIHDEVVTLLIESIELELCENEQIIDSSVEIGVLGLLRRRLTHFLQHPKAKYHPERLLSRFRKEMIDERVTCLSVLGRHKQVLQLYIQELRDFASAESYCDKCYKSHKDLSIYTSLLKIILLCRSDSEEKKTLKTLDGIDDRNVSEIASVGMAIKLLNKFPERMEAPTALNLLPSDVLITFLAPFLCCTFDVQVERHRNGQVQTQLAKMENFKVRELLSMRRKASVTIWASQCCQMCECKLGLGTTVRMPGGSLVHYGCHLAQIGAK
ncbi:hypothetical protein ABG067_002443 [Albugo candida]